MFYHHPLAGFLYFAFAYPRTSRSVSLFLFLRLHSVACFSRVALSPASVIFYHLLRCRKHFFVSFFPPASISASFLSCSTRSSLFRKSSRTLLYPPRALFYFFKLSLLKLPVQVALWPFQLKLYPTLVLLTSLRLGPLNAPSALSSSSTVRFSPAIRRARSQFARLPFSLEFTKCLPSTALPPLAGLLPSLLPIVACFFRFTYSLSSRRALGEPRTEAISKAPNRSMRGHVGGAARCCAAHDS
jgi:hypothetical protein